MIDLEGSTMPRNTDAIKADLDVLDTDYQRKALLRLAADVEPLLEELARLKRGFYSEQQKCEAELAAALGYEHSDEYGWIIGAHTITTLASEAGRRIRELERQVSELHGLATTDEDARSVYLLGGG